MSSRGFIIRRVAPAAIAAAALSGACGNSTATSAPSQTPSPSAAVSIAPSQSPSGEPAVEAEAIRIVKALGGEVPPGFKPTITYGDSIAGASSVHVALGDWQLAWDSKRVLRHIFWEQTLPTQTTMPEVQARDRIARFAAALELGIGDPKEMVAQTEAWMAAWPRLVDGVPAEENGTRIWVNNNGSFLQYTFGWNELAPKPASTVTEAQAVAAVDQCKADLAECEASLVWHLPSSAEAEAPLVLCWIVGPKGGVGEWRVWVDAGTGTVVDVAAQLN